MLKGIDENGNLKNIKVTENGELIVNFAGSGSSEATSTVITNTTSNPVPVNVVSGITMPTEISINNQTAIPVSGNVNVNNNETTLSAGVLTLGTTAQTVSINKKVTEISIANYSETADVTITIGQTSYVVGSNIAVDIPINKTVINIGLVSTEADTKVQYVIKGEE